jgi:hypothetical protein
LRDDGFWIEELSGEGWRVMSTALLREKQLNHVRGYDEHLSKERHLIEIKRAK